MTQLFHTSLRARLVLLLFPVVALFLGMGVCAIAMFSRLAGGVNEAVTDNYQSIMAAQSISALLGDLAQDPFNPANQHQGDLNRFEMHARQIEENLALLSKHSPLPGERALILGLVAQYQELKKAAMSPVPLNSIKAPSDLRDSGLVLRIAQMRAGLEKIRGLNHQAILAANQEIQKTARQVRRLMVISLAAVLVVSMASCYWIGRSILQPILALTEATRELGDGVLREPVPVLTHDELGTLAASFNKMASLLQEYRRSTTEKIVHLHRTMESTLASFPDPVFVLNQQGEIELKNPAAVSFSTSLQLNHRLPERLQAIAQSTLGGGPNFLPDSFAEVLCFRLADLEKYFLPRVLAIKDREGVLFGVAVVLHDVTRFRLLDSAKTNLVATVSHELKSPLTSVRMALHLLLEKTLGGLTSKQEQLLQAAREDSERLLGILNDLLDLARLEEGDSELRLEKVTPLELVHQVREEMADRAAAKGVCINCVAAAQLPVVAVDRQRINHVFTNLMTNAIKYSPANGVILVRATHDGNGSVQFSVTDQGAGIDPQYQARVFDRFFRVPGQEKTGAGLGLSIAREITVAHGGRIGVKSTPASGTTFYVVLKTAA